jgi:hypothetical protein
MGVLRSLSVALCALVAAGAACGGREDVVLVASSTDFADGGGGDACQVASMPHACLPNGGGCKENGDCCSQRCDTGVCLEAGTCGGPGAGCKVRGDCCSGRCEPIAGALTCLNYCAADGLSCSRAFDCCSMACNGGTCGGRLCLGEGENGCTDDASCCSGTCDQVLHRCASSPPCKGSLQECEGTGTGGCCSGVCSAPNDGRCDFGPGPCRPMGTFCLVDTDCCRGTCSGRVCTAPCLQDGEACTSGADCCGKVCTGSPQKCGQQCKALGIACTDDAQCCSGQCIEGQCANLCTPK